MPEITQCGGHTIKSHGYKLLKLHIFDWLTLVILGGIDICLNVIEPFHRYVSADMMTDIKYPFKEDTVPMFAVPVYAVILPIIVFLLNYLRRRDVYDLHHAILGIGFSVLLTGVITDAIKDAVGRPRPNFFWRCFPHGVTAFDSLTGDVLCNGDEKIIKEGYKSFPSGHTSWSFAGLGFLSWYLSGKIQVFDKRGHAGKLCIVMLPYLMAALVGISRIDDYWHHWNDVFAGAFIGTLVSSLCYLQFFPFPHTKNCWAPHAFFRELEKRMFQNSNAETGSGYVRGISAANQQDAGLELEAMESGRRF